MALSFVFEPIAHGPGIPSRPGHQSWTGLTRVRTKRLFRRALASIGHVVCAPSFSGAKAAASVAASDTIHV
jgi:hypothetical protein